MRSFFIRVNGTLVNTFDGKPTIVIAWSESEAAAIFRRDPQLCGAKTRVDTKGATITAEPWRAVA